MNLNPDDQQRAAAYQQLALGAFPVLTQPQLDAIRNRARDYQSQFRAHPALHDTVNVLLLLGLFAADLLSLTLLPSLLPWPLSTPGGTVLAGMVSGAVHGFLVCGIVTFSVHEGAAHNLLILGRGRVARGLRVLANNACRLFLADPLHYAEAHASHHRSLGTPDDGSFTHFVRFRRLLGSLLPLAPMLSHSDYFPWRPQEHTRSRQLSVALTNAYLALCAVLATWLHGFLFTGVALFLVGSWLSFVLDRLRESTEHLFMPLDRVNGTRELGLGFWGLLLGGGPWGQPCHLAHHLAPALPWYQQLRLHFFLRRLLTPEQRRHFFLRPVVGLPALLWRLATATPPAPARD
ncbi:fatty acid desaturase [Myxococcus sp. CA051A]|uniref:fatty acid desaturase n=1 Tax=unclassified Myxococcus TaxID=2648731 RepID=UPI00157AA5A1|nr:MULTISPECIES: fatty acid desaturase [unclassified Myxococcus]NTX14094.1 fatty acid desaturase [Myxococcus sp. CA056]NTX62076.1 fatty acid desaturase [Myxococcus sp. CA051A]